MRNYFSAMYEAGLAFPGFASYCFRRIGLPLVAAERAGNAATAFAAHSTGYGAAMLAGGAALGGLCALAGAPVLIGFGVGLCFTAVATFPFFDAAHKAHKDIRAALHRNNFDLGGPGSFGAKKTAKPGFTQSAAPAQGSRLPPPRKSLDHQDFSL